MRKEKLCEFEFLGEGLSGFLIGFLEIAHEALPLRDHLEESAARMKVFLVFLQMIGQFLDPFGKHRDLILWRSRILLVPFHLLSRFCLLFRRQHMLFVRHRTRSPAEAK